jgi:tripartite motif-containing protein 71
VAVDRQGNIFVADNGHDCVKKLGPDGTLISSFGKRGSAPGEFILPVGLAVTDDGEIYVADSGNKRIQVFDAEGKFKRSIPVDGWTKGVFNLPYIVLDRAGSIYATDPLNNRALKYSSKGTLMGVLKPQRDGKDLFNTPTGLALDEDHELAYIVDTWNHCVRKFPLDEFTPEK